MQLRSLGENNKYIIKSQSRVRARARVVCVCVRARAPACACVRACALVTYLILLPHMPVMFMVSLIETAGHKMAAFDGRVFVTFKHRIFLDRF